MPEIVGIRCPLCLLLYSAIGDPTSAIACVSCYQIPLNINHSEAPAPLPAVFLEFPVPVIQGTHRPCLEPSRNAMEVKGVIANTPSNCALLAGRRGLVRLTFDTQIHYVIAADGAVIHNNIPRPKSNGVKLLHLESLLALPLPAVRLLSARRCRGVCHVNVCHGHEDAKRLSLAKRSREDLVDGRPRRRDGDGRD